MPGPSLVQENERRKQQPGRMSRDAGIIDTAHEVSSLSPEIRSMVKAIVSRGEIRPLEPLPADWQEGQELRIEKVDEAEPPLDDIDRDFAALASLCASNEPADEEMLERALQEARRQAKEQVRRHMGVA